MRSVVVSHPADFAGWRDRARALLAGEVAPAEVLWTVAAEGQATLFDAVEDAPAAGARASFMVPRGFVALAADAVQHSDPERFPLLYRLLWRLAHGERELLSIPVDPDVHRATAMARSVRRDVHKMHAFVRFRQIEDADPPCFIAWFEPEHYVVETGVPFFVRRFANMRWSILTPYRSAHWTMTDLLFGPGARRSDVQAHDALDGYWRTYYTSIFNPARLNTTAMRSEMPKKYWRNLPEARLIAPLVEAAGRRTAEMVMTSATAANPKRRVRPTASQVTPTNRESIDALRERALGCRDCPLWAPATQTVFGEGPADAAVMFVGEQPGDQEDLAGRPFVGPAGEMFDRALAEAGIDRSRTYVTNAVKHFKFAPRGKRRLHQKPNTGEVAACRQWLVGEIESVQPNLVVALGATAAQSLFGRPTKIGEARGRIMPLDERRRALVTVHPSYLLRLPDEAVRQAEYHRFVADLRLASDLIAA